MVLLRLVWIVLHRIATQITTAAIKVQLTSLQHSHEVPRTNENTQQWRHNHHGIPCKWHGDDPETNYPHVDAGYTAAQYDNKHQSTHSGVGQEGMKKNKKIGIQYSYIMETEQNKYRTYAGMSCTDRCNANTRLEKYQNKIIRVFNKNFARFWPGHNS